VHPVVKDDGAAHGKRHIHERSGGGGGGAITHSAGRMGVVRASWLERMVGGGGILRHGTRQIEALSIVNQKDRNKSTTSE
jgi:hypothetical protein